LPINKQNAGKPGSTCTDAGDILRDAPSTALHLPRGCGAPVIIGVAGGGWRLLWE